MTNLVTIILMTNIFVMQHPSGHVECRKDVICAEVQHKVDVLGTPTIFTNYVFVATNVYDPIWVLRMTTNRPKLRRDPLNDLPPFPIGKQPKKK